MRGRIDLADEARHLAHLGRSVPRPGPVGRTHVIRNANERDVEADIDIDPRRTHEGRNVGKAWNDRRIDRVQRRHIVHVRLPRR